jgi:hypothetical protein
MTKAPERGERSPSVPVRRYREVNFGRPLRDLLLLLVFTQHARTAKTARPGVLGYFRPSLREGSR